MHVLVLDDCEERHAAFRKSYADDCVSSVHRYVDFVLKLSERRWDVIHLDHDLGDFVSNPDTWVDGWGSIREFTGVEAAARILELDDELRPARVIIQSINPVGAQRMLHMLKQGGLDVVWEPFGEPA